MKSSCGALRAAKIAFLEACEIDRRTTFRKACFFFFMYFFRLFAECILTLVKRTLAPPRALPKPILNFCSGLREAPGRPKGRNGRPQRPPEIAKRGQRGDRGCRRPLREHPWSPKGLFSDSHSYLGKTHIGPQGPPEVTSFFFRAPFWGGKNAQVAISSDPSRAYKFSFGPFWRHLGPNGSKKGTTLP